MNTGYSNSLKKIVEIAKGRELIFWGTDFLSKYVYEELNMNGCDIKYFVTDQVKENIVCGKEVKQDIELIYEDIDKVFVVAFVFKDHGNIFQRLSNMGFKFERDFLLYGFAGYLQKFDVIDSLIGYNRYYGNELGFLTCGKIQENSYKIMVLGGSTTDPTMGNNMPWTDYLYNKLYKKYKNIVIVNGGMAGYSANQEFYKLVRDGLEYKPNMLLTFDGLNDVSCMATDRDYPILTPYARKVFNYIEKKGDFAPDTLEIRNASSIVHGISQSNKNDKERWMESMRKIHAVAEEFGITHLGFFQPMIMTGNPVIKEKQIELIKNASEVLPIYKEWMTGMRDFYHGVLPFINEKNYMYDLTTIFDSEEDTYYDFCHATNRGNEIIAESIYNSIIGVIDEELGKC